MKTIFITIIYTVILFTGCNNNKATKQPGDDQNTSAVKENTQENREERNKQVALQCIRAWSSGNVDEIVSHLAANTVDYGDGSTPPARGIDTVKMFINMWRFAVNEYKSSNEISVADSDYVFIYADWSGSFKNDFMGMKTAGKSFKFKDVDIFKFNDEAKITEHRAVLFSTFLKGFASDTNKFRKKH